MRAVMILDRLQLERIDHSIRALAELPLNERARKMHLLNALERERTELIGQHRSRYRHK